MALESQRSSSLRRAQTTVGIDLAASPRNTAVCEVHWQADHATVERVRIPVDDCAFLDLLWDLPAEARVGLDCPLGWPGPFVAAVRAHHEHEPWPTRGSTPDRGPMVWRATDHWVRERTGRWPLSVSTDRLGVTALRAAYLLDSWEAAGVKLDRTGVTGPLVEVYPAAARRVWGLGAERSVDELEASLPLEFTDPSGRAFCDGSDHVFDALVSALVARAAALGHTTPPPSGLLDVAAREGWIHLPHCTLPELLQG